MRNRYPVLLFLLITATLLVVRMRADYGSTGLTVHVSVQATDSSGGTLHYAWRSTDGSIQNVDSPSTSWTLPQSRGIHFAYVLVYNGLGGYTERRILVNTDTLLSDDTVSDSSTWVNPYVAPAAPAQTGDYYRARVVYYSNPAGNQLYVPNASVFLTDLNTGLRYPPSGAVTSNLRGEFVIPGVPPSDNEDITCTVGTDTSDCFDDSVMLNTATSHYLAGGINTLNGASGTFTLADGSPCGTVNEFFGVHVTAQATLVDASNNVLAGPVTVNELGDYMFPDVTGAAAAVVTCEGAPAQTAALSLGGINGNTFATIALTGITPPTVAGMTATLHGTPLPATVAKFLPPPSGLPSDIAPLADVFLSEKGVDSRLGACKYYLAIGAVRGCGPNGELVKPITFHDWQRAVKIGRYASGVPTYHAAYINKVDLNLARVHQSTSYGPNDTAAVVCNHVGANDFFNPTQSDVDASVLNAVNNKNLVACVAMDYTVSSGVNGGQPFVRFLIFGPSGQLLPSVNLDGRREKFVPGTCVVCHGGDHYAGKFPEDGSGFANVGGRFLPYDVGNFEFASTSSLTKCAQEDQIYHLNQNVLNAGPNVAENELIPGWYSIAGSTVGSVTCPSTTHHVLNEDYVPTSWQASGDPVAIDYYKTVNARSCRTCHVAMIEGYNFDHYDNIVNTTSTDALPGGQFDFDVTVCGGPTVDFDVLRWYTMPNSLVTYNRFWLSYNNTVGQPDQVASFINFANDTGNAGECNPTPPQVP